MEEESLLALNPTALRADKYLLPLVQDSDYPRLAKWILARFDMPEEGPLDVNLLAERMEMKLLPGRFPENSVTGEIFSTTDVQRSLIRLFMSFIPIMNASC